MMRNKDFAVFILTHGRADKVVTYKLLREQGYTGRIYLIIDNEDDTAKDYYDRYGDEVIMFDKKAIAETFDEGENFGDRRSITCARNASFQIARDLGITYFIELDDDYTGFAYKTNGEFKSINHKDIRNIDNVFDYLLEFYISIDAKSIAVAQGGDFLGGLANDIDRSINRRRKCMNSFICSTERPFQFVGTMNEDVNTYTWFQSLGNLFMTFPLVYIVQLQTQSNSGGMSEFYKEHGTYKKSFYTVMFMPSCVTIKMMQSTHSRLHHSISWDQCVPVIISEDYRKMSLI